MLNLFIFGVYFDSLACVLTTICGKFELKVVFDKLQHHSSFISRSLWVLNTDTFTLFVCYKLFVSICPNTDLNNG